MNRLEKNREPEVVFVSGKKQKEYPHRPEGLNTVFCEIKGTNCIANYAEDLFKLRRTLDRCIVINGKRSEEHTSELQSR